MNKKAFYGSSARAKVMAGVNKIADAVCVTLGPSGRNVLISQSMIVDYGTHSLPIHISKDGYTVAKAFDLDDPFEKPGVLMAKECTQRTVDQAGDGTTTTLVLMRAIVNEGVKLIEAGANPMQLKKEIDEAVEYVVSELKKMAIPVKGDIEKIRQIATVSANNDRAIGDMIADAFAKIGDEGIIDIEQSKSVNTEIKISDGYKFNKGWISPLFVNNKDKQTCEFSDPYILLYDKRVLHHSQMQRALQITADAGKPLLIICEDSAEEGLAFLAMNNIQNRVRVCAVKAPSFGDGRREEMEDMALLTGGTYISDIRGVDVKEIELANLGRAKKVVITKDETVIIGGAHNGIDLENMLNELRMNLTQAKNEDDRFPIEKRIARLSGGVAVIQVGANTDTEMKERTDRFDDSIRATKAAIAEGYLAGGGSVLWEIRRKKIRPKTLFEMFLAWLYSLLIMLGFAEEKKTGSDLLISILDSPLKQICQNSGTNYNSMIKKLTSPGLGYNAKTDSVEDLKVSGIIDPAKVLRCSLQNAASSAGMILTSECIICDTM